ncbi:hypothetical protein C8Q78DRAFT_207619 [Trametes maxima]|nr:hypothetical protein C8Q78DRAFT_207619 [Trametes maxima]
MGERSNSIGTCDRAQREDTLRCSQLRRFATARSAAETRVRTCTRSSVEYPSMCIDISNIESPNQSLLYQYSTCGRSELNPSLSQVRNRNNQLTRRSKHYHSESSRRTNTVGPGKRHTPSAAAPQPSSNRSPSRPLIFQITTHPPSPPLPRAHAFPLFLLQVASRTHTHPHGPLESRWQHAHEAHTSRTTRTARASLTPFGVHAEFPTIHGRPRPRTRTRARTRMRSRFDIQWQDRDRDRTR